MYTIKIQCLSLQRDLETNDYFSPTQHGKAMNMKKINTNRALAKFNKVVMIECWPDAFGHYTINVPRVNRYENYDRRVKRQRRTHDERLEKEPITINWDSLKNMYNNK